MESYNGIFVFRKGVVAGACGFWGSCAGATTWPPGKIALGHSRDGDAHRNTISVHDVKKMAW